MSAKPKKESKKQQKAKPVPAGSFDFDVTLNITFKKRVRIEAKSKGSAEVQLKYLIDAGDYSIVNFSEDVLRSFVEDRGWDLAIEPRFEMVTVGVTQERKEDDDGRE